MHRANQLDSGMEYFFPSGRVSVVPVSSLCRWPEEAAAEPAAAVRFGSSPAAAAESPARAGFEFIQCCLYGVVVNTSPSAFVAAFPCRESRCQQS